MAFGLLCLSTPASLSSQTTAEEALARYGKAVDRPACDPSQQASEIVVCGSREDRYRLPLPTEPVEGRGAGTPRGEIPGAALDPTAIGPCGIFQGQRRCNKAEAAKDGLGGGRDPISALLKLGTKLADPDADVEAPAPLPDRAYRQPRP